MNGVLVACEESQVVCIAFRKRGIEAYSNDLLDCSGGHPEWHLKMDCREAIALRHWPMIIFHPECRYMALSGNRWYWNSPLRTSAIIWTVETWELACKHSDHTALENPGSVIFSQPGLKNPQYIQPHMFGHGETKRTGLKLRNLPDLVPTNIVNGREHRIHLMPPGPERSKLRSKTYPGIADAMAEQWGKLI